MPGTEIAYASCGSVLGRLVGVGVCVFVEVGVSVLVGVFVGVLVSVGIGVKVAISSLTKSDKGSKFVLIAASAAIKRGSGEY